MEPRKDVKIQPTGTKEGHQARPRRFEIVKLEERMAPKLAANHNETLVREVEAKTERFEIVKLEERIAPRLSANHNETLMRDVL
jgi:hypothetical protein